MRTHYKVELYCLNKTSSTFLDLLQHLISRASISEDISFIKIHDMNTKTSLEDNENSFKDKSALFQKNQMFFFSILGIKQSGRKHIFSKTSMFYYPSQSNISSLHAASKLSTSNQRKNEYSSTH